MEIATNEYNINNVLYHRTWQKFSIIIPNVYIYLWESDLLGITRNGYVTEYEIKTSKADFKNDSKKTQKHGILKTGTYVGGWGGKEIKIGHRPNYFYYVCPDGLINVADVPDYAGLIYIKEKGEWKYLEYVKKAHKIHAEKISEVKVNKITVAFRYKYWQIRLRE